VISGFICKLTDKSSVTESPVSVAARGLVCLSRGLSLRFPRFIKTREDKHIEQGSTPQFFAEIYHGQQKGEPANDEGDLIDLEDLRSSDCSEEENLSV
jgi:DNA ligase-1